MAGIRAPFAPFLTSAASAETTNCSNGISQTRSHKTVSLKSRQKQRRQPAKEAGIDPALSPLLRTEKMAARFGLDLAVDELERLLRNTDGASRDCLQRRLSGPSLPSPPGGAFGRRRPFRVAYQGCRGSYCQEAAAKAFSSVTDCDNFPCDHMEDAFQALNDGSADRAVVPIENSIDGTIDRNLDLLLRHDGIRIMGELILPVNHCLLALPGTSRSDIRRIVSHPQALSHCSASLSADAGLEIDEVASSAAAASYLSENQISDTAVIGSKIAASEFGLEVLEENFQDPSGNVNRFLQLGLVKCAVAQTARPDRRSTGWKTTVAFSLRNGVSDLFRALWHFETRDIAVARIEHRPNRSNPIRFARKEQDDPVQGGELQPYMDYVFLLDLEGSVSESGMRSALTQLQEISVFLRVLGSYNSESLH